MTSSRSGKDFRFAIVDLDKANEYPLNFVCRLPVNLNGIKSENSKFSQIFGRNNMEIAKKLLIEALEDEDDDDLKREVERRLKLLEPNIMHKKMCISCGKIFQVEHKKRSTQRFCENCLKRKFSNSATTNLI